VGDERGSWVGGKERKERKKGMNEAKLRVVRLCSFGNPKTEGMNGGRMGRE